MANNQNFMLEDELAGEPSTNMDQTSADHPLLEDELAGGPSRNMPDQVRRAPAADTSWYDVPGQALKNAPSSALHFAKGMVEPFLHPIETFNSLKDVGSGLVSKASGALGVQQNPAEKERTEAAVNAIGKFYKEKYGSEAGWKDALANDPVGVLGDLSMVLTGGGGLAARAPGLVGKAGAAARAVGDVTNPASLALKAAKPIISTGMKAANYPLALTTGSPTQTLQSALRAGQAGSKGFKEQIGGGSMLGHSDPTPIVEAAYDAVKTLKDKRRENYLNSTEGMRANQAPLSYDHINNTIFSAYNDISHGTQIYKESALPILDEITKAVMDWQKQPNANGVNYHNLDGLDKLKQKIGDIRSSKAIPKSEADLVATKIYNSVKDTLVKHDKKYAEAMGDYSDASSVLNQLQKTMSLNSQATTDSTLRKLLLGQKQVDGNKASLLKQLSEINPELEYMIAGHLLQPIIPVGLRGAINAGVGGLGFYNGVTNPVGALGHAIASSPRAMGSLNYNVGKLTAPGSKIPGSLSTVPASFSESSREMKPKRKEEPAPYYPGEDEEASPLTIRRARGGKVGHQHLVDRLMRLAEQAKKASNASTEPLLNAPDEAVIKALDIAQRHI